MGYSPFIRPDHYCRRPPRPNASGVPSSRQPGWASTSSAVVSLVHRGVERDPRSGEVCSGVPGSVDFVSGFLNVCRNLLQKCGVAVCRRFQQSASTPINRRLFRCVSS
ncbi:hypothetical protein ABVT39_000269 [Epinephelus coioides]